MISSIAGDLIGSSYEHKNNREFKSLFSQDSDFTDDTVLTVATADAILNNKSYADVYYEYATRYPNRGYGSSFKKQLEKGKLEPYNSYGNGSAMRVSPIGWRYFATVPNTFPSVLFIESKESAACTHDHPEGIKGAQFVAYTIWLIRYLKEFGLLNKLILRNEFLRGELKEKFDYKLDTRTEDFGEMFCVTCQGTIPRCFSIFYESDSFEDAMKKSIEMGGDVDTNCCIVGAFCDAYYGLPSAEIIQEVYKRLPREMAEIVTEFTKKYINPSFEEPFFNNEFAVNNPILSLDISDL